MVKITYEKGNGRRLIYSYKNENTYEPHQQMITILNN